MSCPTISEIRKRLASKPKIFHAESNLTPAAVLIPLFHKQKELHILFTQRTDNVESHKGEVSFPGGVREDKDKSLKETALRETFEEVGIKPESVKILGKMEDFPTITGFVITPYIGYFSYPAVFNINSEEVESLLEVPLDFFLDKRNRRYMKRSYRGREYLLEYFEWDGKIIWGATSRILMNFLEVIGVYPDY